MSEQLAFEAAPYEKLCRCVSVELTPDQERLMDVWPDRSASIVKAAMFNGQQRHVDGECTHCNGVGLLPT